ncbi:MAG: HDOD domain-containing protein, partial [Undibacterium sp.]|nr:HDOD domain-containing protein [Undibacterium sp.]
DAALSFMLFKLVSSAAFAQSIKVRSFAQAISLLGRRQLQRWLQLLLYARQADQGTALNPLMLRAAFRAAFMEGLCARAGGNSDERDCAFMVGIFSLLDTLFSCPLWEILKPLNISDEVRDALIDRTGLLGQQLKIAELSDRAASPSLDLLIKNNDIAIDAFYDLQIVAYAWVNQICQEI